MFKNIKRKLDDGFFILHLMVVIVIGFVLVTLGTVIYDGYQNQQEVGKFINSNERACLDFCYPNEYYFGMSSLFGSGDCKCKPQEVVIIKEK